MVQSPEFKSERIGKARGLTIFNTSTSCIETWSGSRWIGQCADCSDVTVLKITAPVNICLPNTDITFTASYAGDYTWQISDDNGATWTDVIGTDVQQYSFSKLGTYLVRTSVIGCNEKFSNTLSVTVVYDMTELANLKIRTLNNVMYSYQYIKLGTYLAAGSPTSYQWYMRFSGYAYQGQDNLPTIPAKNEVTDIIAGATQPSYTFDPSSCSQYQGPGTYHFYCKASGNGESLDSIFIRVEDLYDASRGGGIANPLLITKAKWVEDSIAAISVPKQEGPMYFIPVAAGGTGTNLNGLPNLRVAHANLGSIATRNAGELGNLYQWARNEDGHEVRQYGENFSKWDSLDYSTGFVSDSYYGQASNNQPMNGKFFYGHESWITPNNLYDGGWGTGVSTDPCTSRNSLWRIPSGNGPQSDFARSIHSGSTISNYNMADIYTESSTTTDIYRYGTNNYSGSLAVVSKYTFGGNKHYVVIFPASGVREGLTGKLVNVGKHGSYWSSSYLSNNTITTQSFGFYFYTKHLSIGINHGFKSDGLCVRCVTEN
ncbi:MAG: hypothetical protein LBS50_06735 [Prevotellaceae bacterium]|nr:hypothetical protein [Prevotellaceae bacterium]